MACTANTQLITFIVREIKITCGFELIIVLMFVKSTQLHYYDVEYTYVKLIIIHFQDGGRCMAS